MTRPQLRVVRTPDEETRRDQVMTAVADLVRKYDQHKARNWKRSDGREYIALGALDAVVAAYRGTEESP